MVTIPEYGTSCAECHRVSSMPLVAIFHTPLVTLSTLAAGNARLSLSHLDAGSGGGHKANLIISSRSPHGIHRPYSR